MVCDNGIYSVQLKIIVSVVTFLNCVVRRDPEQPIKNEY